MPCQLPSFLSPWLLSSMFIPSSKLTVLVPWSFLSILLSSCAWGPLWLFWTHPDNLSLHLCPWFRGTSIRYFLSGQRIDMFRESELCSGACSAYCVCSPRQELFGIVHLAETLFYQKLTLLSGSLTGLWLPRFPWNPSNGRQHLPRSGISSGPDRIMESQTSGDVRVAAQCGGIGVFLAIAS